MVLLVPVLWCGSAIALCGNQEALWTTAKPGCHAVWAHAVEAPLCAGQRAKSIAPSTVRREEVGTDKEVELATVPHSASPQGPCLGA